MTLALCCLSHSPLYGVIDPGKAVFDEINRSLGTLRDFATRFDPELAIVFGPDHFNGVFYDMMPAFCIGASAHSIGDWGTTPGPLNVDADAAHRLTGAVLEAGVDVAQSERFSIDHGIAQPLEFLFGDLTRVPVVPVFINAVGLPLGPMQRIRLLGEAIGREVARWNKRVLLIGSGGLSHDPPVPRLAESSSEVRERLLGGGRVLSPEAREARQRRVIDSARAYALGEATQLPVNPEFDRLTLDTLASRRLNEMDGWKNDWIEQTGGHSAHEIRTWLASFAALGACGPYELFHREYWAIKEWNTGFATVGAVLQS
ncbi:3-carboxyethylcatechol 2,3-dioxygenase [Paraburkholderia sp. J12]|uniref:3-carboxyethylcatechol 2,3-dioxygenase n=1 Tax=Paraburkholderia sp. J12 TaxID=2805432 RepID=UPI002ABE29D9|nr:3-carboxyethylcatechol 2,3-dioxygenase [Paraburkholderia sp. J12]